MNETDRRLAKLEEKTDEGDRGVFVTKSVFNEWARSVKSDVGRLYAVLGLMISGLIAVVVNVLHGGFR